MMMLKNLYFDSDVITFDADFKDQICEELKIELRTLYNSTGRLIKLKIITKFGKSRLRINNKMFHKGKVKNERRQPNRNMPKGEGF